jgi:UDP-3-O-[3-hydroxymyristoyl] glucosamine N-acyltransferase
VRSALSEVYGQLDEKSYVITTGVVGVGMLVAIGRGVRVGMLVAIGRGVRVGNVVSVGVTEGETVDVEVFAG